MRRAGDPRSAHQDVRVGIPQTCCVRNCSIPLIIIATRYVAGGSYTAWIGSERRRHANLRILIERSVETTDGQGGKLFRPPCRYVVQGDASAHGA